MTRYLIILLIHFFGVLVTGCQGCAGGGTGTFSADLINLATTADITAFADLLSTNAVESLQPKQNVDITDEELVDLINKLLQFRSFSVDDAVVARIMQSRLSELFDSDIEVQEYEPNEEKSRSLCDDSYSCNLSGDQGCAWRNTKVDDKWNFFTASGSPRTNIWSFLTSSEVLPKSPYFLLAAPAAENTEARLVTDDITDGGSGSVTVKLSLVRRKLVDCSRAYTTEDSPGPIRVRLETPAERFKLALVATNFITEPGGFVVLDDIEVLCDDTRRRFKPPSFNPTVARQTVLRRSNDKVHKSKRKTRPF